jgi:hypothetical protein
MKSLVLTIVALAGVALFAGESQANHRRRQSCCEIAPTCCAAPCAPVAAAPAPAPVQYVEQKVTRYKQEMVTKEITELVCKTITKEVPYKYTVQIPVVTPTKQVVTVCKTVQKEVPYTFTVLVPKTVQQKVMQTTYTCVTEVVQKQVPVCRTVRVPCVDACGNCTYVCQRVTEMQVVNCNVVKRVPTTQEVVVNRTICEPVQKQGTRIVCELVNVQQEVTVNVCTFKTEEREGKRLVCEVVTEKVNRKVQVCQLTPYTETIRVPVAAPCATTCCCEPACSSGHGHARRGLFQRRSSCCN